MKFPKGSEDAQIEKSLRRNLLRRKLSRHDIDTVLKARRIIKHVDRMMYPRNPAKVFVVDDIMGLESVIACYSRGKYAYKAPGIRKLAHRIQRDIREDLGYDYSFESILMGYAVHEVRHRMQRSRKHIPFIEKTRMPSNMMFIRAHRITRYNMRAYEHWKKMYRGSNPNLRFDKKRMRNEFDAMMVQYLALLSVPKFNLSALTKIKEILNLKAS